MPESHENERFGRVAQKLHGTLLHAWPLSGGISARTAALEIAHPKGSTERVVVRQPGDAALARNPHAARDEYQVLGAVHALGIAAPRPILLDESGEVFPAPYLVMEYIEGAADFAPANRADAAQQLGEELARIHSADSGGLVFLPAMPAELGAPNHATALQTAHIRAALENAWPPVRQNRAALLHGDFWPGNVLWRGNALAAVIDWEDAALGDPLRDLAIARLDLLWIFGRDAMEAFTAAYRAHAPFDDAALPHWDLYAALRLARLVGTDLDGWAAFFVPFGRPDITANSIRTYYTWFTAQSLAQLGQ